MRKILLPLALGVAIVASGQYKVNLIGIEKLKEINTEVRSRGMQAPIVEALAKMNPGWTTDILDRYDAKIVAQVDDEIIAFEVPSDRLEDFANDPAVFYVEYGRELKLDMNMARPASKVSNVQNGFEYEDATISFTGKDVITGVVDQGLDPNHPNFLNEAGKSRVIAAYKLATTVTSATNALTIARFTTDNENATHGSHVSGIMAGSYKGTATLAQSYGSTEGDMPYYGVATDAKIVMAGGTLTNSNVIKGVGYVVENSKDYKLPAVINLSLGTNIGPHDGTGVLEQGISKYANDAIICISAGNEGDGKVFVGKKFTATSTELKTFFTNAQSAGVDIWGNSDEPFTVTLALYANSTGALTEVASVSAAGESATTSSTFSTYVNGSATLTAEVNPLNNRFHVLVSGIFTQKNSTYNVALIIKGKNKQQVYAYGYAQGAYPITTFTNNRKSGYTDGSANGSISDLACALNTIAVGSYTTRISWPTFAGDYKYSGGGYTLNTISPFSSYGLSYQGDVLPQVCAPGANIISSLNRYYTKNITSASELNPQTSASVAGDKLTAYWGPMQGTSMSCPYVAGTIALWLEADPSLTVNDVKEIFAATNGNNDSSSDSGTTLPGISGGSSSQNTAWGGGSLDALAGIKEVLRRKSEAGIDGVIADAKGNFVITPRGRGIYNIIVDGAANLNAHLFNMQGVAIATAHANGNEVTIDASNVSDGIYILSITSPNIAKISQRVIIK